MWRSSSWRSWGRFQTAAESGWRNRGHSPGAGAPRTEIPGASSAEEHVTSAFLGPRSFLSHPHFSVSRALLPSGCFQQHHPHPPRPCSEAVNIWTLGHMGVCLVHLNFGSPGRWKRGRRREELSGVSGLTLGTLTCSGAMPAAKRQKRAELESPF